LKKNFVCYPVKKNHTKKNFVVFNSFSVLLFSEQLRVAILRLIGSGEDVFRSTNCRVWEATHLAIPRPFPRTDPFVPEVVGTAWGLNMLEVLRLIQTREFVLKFSLFTQWPEVPFVSQLRMHDLCPFWVLGRQIASEEMMGGHNSIFVLF